MSLRNLDDSFILADDVHRAWIFDFFVIKWLFFVIIIITYYLEVKAGFRDLLTYQIMTAYGSENRPFCVDKTR